MPGFRFLVTLTVFIACASPSRAEEPTHGFAAPDSKARISFASGSYEGSRQLRGLADGFSSQAQAQFAEPALPTAAIRSAGGGTNDSTFIRQVSAEVPQSNDGQVDEFQNTENEVPAREISLEETAPADNTAGLLDKPLTSGDGTAAKGKMSKPDFRAGIAPLISIFGSLLIVLSAFLLVMFLFKKVSPKGSRSLPKEAFENLGRTFLTPKLQLHLLRLGNRLILVSVTPDGVSPVTEVTDPDEVVPLLGMCRKLDTNSSTELFRKTLSGFSGDNSYFGTEPDSGTLSKTSTSPKKKSRTKPSGLVDLYSEPDESLADILAAGLGAKGGKHG